MLRLQPDIQLVGGPMSGTQPSAEGGCIIPHRSLDILERQLAIGKQRPQSPRHMVERAACGRGSVRWASKVPCPNVGELHGHAAYLLYPANESPASESFLSSEYPDGTSDKARYSGVLEARNRSRG